MSKPLLCAYCHKPGDLHRDHVVPRSRGGPDNATNIVMACQSCNSSKGDLLASEWLGDRCPPDVRKIEERVNKKLASEFKGRNSRRHQPTIYAFHVKPDGSADYCGQLVSETEAFLRIEAADALLLWAGLWSLSGELCDLPRAECRLFNDRDACVEAMFRHNEKSDRATV